MGRLPTKQLLCFGGICPEGRQVSIAPGADHIRKFHIVGRLKSMDQLAHGDAVAGTQVDGLHTGMILGVLQSLPVAHS